MLMEEYHVGGVIRACPSPSQFSHLSLQLYPCNSEGLTLRLWTPGRTSSLGDHLFSIYRRIILTLAPRVKTLCIIISLMLSVSWLTLFRTAEGGTNRYLTCQGHSGAGILCHEHPGNRHRLLWNRTPYTLCWHGSLLLGSVKLSPIYTIRSLKINHSLPNC